MEQFSNIALNTLPYLHSNVVTAGLIAGTTAEVLSRGIAERNVGALATDVFSATLLGLATAVILPELGIHTTPEIVAYVAAIGFNIPTFFSVLNGVERIQDTSFAIGLTAAGAGAIVDISGSGINLNKIIKMII